MKNWRICALLSLTRKQFSSHKNHKNRFLYQFKAFLDKIQSSIRYMVYQRYFYLLRTIFNAEKITFSQKYLKKLNVNKFKNSHNLVQIRGS